MGKKTPTAAVKSTSKPIPVSSMNYRPYDYFGRQDMQTTLMTHVKGTVRRNALRAALEAGEVSEVPDSIKSAALSDSAREMISSIHPSFMGGEYLPTAKSEELEIARISIKSTTGDVTSLYARQVGRRIAYRVVDEYGGDCLSGRTTRTSIKVLTMGQLIEFFMGAWDLYVCLDCNFEDDLEGMPHFFRGESEFYPCFDATLRDLMRQKFARQEDLSD